jgi:hypothetical protein
MGRKDRCGKIIPKEKMKGELYNELIGRCKIERHKMIL